MQDSYLFHKDCKVVLVGKTTLDVSSSIRLTGMSEFSWPVAGFDNIIFVIRKDIENDFEPNYITIRGKGDVIAKLKSLIDSGEYPNGLWK